MNYLSEKERNDNAAQQEELIRLVLSKQAVLTVGAGCSMPVGYPSWWDLLTEIEQAAVAIDTAFSPDLILKGRDYLKYVDSLRAAILKKTASENQYQQLLEKIFKKRNPPHADIHEILVSLPFKAILTTNYDPSLDSAASSVRSGDAHDCWVDFASQTPQRISDFLNQEKRLKIGHLHGRFDQPGKIILSGKDYSDYYGPPGEWPFKRRLLWSFFATGRMVFVGFSLNDPAFKEILKVTAEEFWRWRESTHFLITDIDEKNKDQKIAWKERLKQETGIATVFFDNTDTSFRGLNLLMQEIGRRCGSASTAAPSGLDWFEQMNRKIIEQRRSV